MPDSLNYQILWSLYGKKYFPNRPQSGLSDTNSQKAVGLELLIPLRETLRGTSSFAICGLARRSLNRGFASAKTDGAGGLSFIKDKVNILTVSVIRAELMCFANHYSHTPPYGHPFPRGKGNLYRARLRSPFQMERGGRVSGRGMGIPRSGGVPRPQRGRGMGILVIRAESEERRAESEDVVLRKSIHWIASLRSQ